jgi:hypothetical protein
MKLRKRTTASGILEKPAMLERPELNVRDVKGF